MMFNRSLLSLYCALMAATALFAAGCSSGSETPAPAPAPAPPPPPPGSSSVEREINPALTNPALTASLSPHFVINPDPAVAAAGRLFVMLPGTGAIPRTYREIVRTGASRGYHSLGLTYINDDAIEGLCGASSVPNCAELARREVINGEDVSPLVAVDPANSITGRLQSLLVYLNATFPNENWGRYLASGQVDYSLVTIAGHSQGAGHAGFLAKQRDLNRVVMFSGPADSGIAPGSANPWASFPNITPAARQFAFIHAADPLAPVGAVSANWDAIDLDLFGPLTSVDGATAPFANAHQLITSAPPNPNPTGPSAAPAHGAPVVDAVTPRDAQGAPLYRPVWIYLAFP